MQVPGLSDEELDAFLREGAWVAKVATHNEDGTIRITPLWYEVEDGGLRFNTWERTEAAANLRRDPRASVLVDSTEQPYMGVHFTGEAEVDTEASTPEQIGEMFARYRGGYQPAVEYAQALTGMGKRVFIHFEPTDSVTWDFSKG